MSIFFGNRLNRIVRAPEGDGGGGGGGGSFDPKEFASLKEQNAALMARLEALEKKGNPDPKKDPPADPDLAEKARLEREQKDKAAKSTAEIEKALAFNMGGPEFMKANASLLPKSIESIFVQAEKENYGSATEKAAAIKVGIISEFFALEDNMKDLTGPQKLKVEEFKKLTKTDKQERAGVIWDEIFEPAFESMKKVKRAAQMAAGQNPQTDNEKALADRMMKQSRKHYLGEKNA